MASVAARPDSAVTRPRTDAIFVVNGGSSKFASAADRERFTSLIHTRFAGAAVEFTRAPDDIKRHLAWARKRGISTVIACGGDGTISALATEIADTEITLGVIPCGTFNHFAKDLDIPLDHEKALDVLATGRVESVDVGEVNGRCFVNNSGLGMYPDAVVMRDARREKGARKWTSAIIAGLRSLRRYRMLAVKVKVDGEELLRRTPVVFIGNNEYVMASALDPRRTSLNDGELCLYIPHPRRPLAFVWLTLRSMFGGLRPADEFDIIRAPALTIESKCQRLRVALDGEIELMAPPLEYRARPAALRVIVPDQD